MWFVPWTLKEFLKELLSEYVGLICLLVIMTVCVVWGVYKESNMQLAVRIPDHLVSMLDEHVDGTRYASRAQLITIIVDDWLAEKEKNDMMQQLNFRVSKELVKRAKKHVDGIQFKSVGHILNIAIADWLAAEKEKGAFKHGESNASM